jgi:beta-fructofuranosidase
VEWELRPPLSLPGQGFGQLEVFQTHVVDGRQVLLFNCLAGDASDRVKATGTEGGVWIASAESPLGPYDIAGAQRIDDPELYVGKFIDDRETGETKFMAFRNETGGQFIGEITDPYAVTWDGEQLAFAAKPVTADAQA